jgi:hypothetical protein
VTEFFVGDRVRLRPIPDSPPLSPHVWGRPGRVIRRDEDGGYVVRGEDGDWGAVGIPAEELEKMP